MRRLDPESFGLITPSDPIPSGTAFIEQSKMKYSLLFLLCSMCASQANATVTLDFQMGSVNTSSSLVLVPTGTVGILVADNFSTGLPASSDLVGVQLSAGGIIGDSQILSVMQATAASNYFSNITDLELIGGLTGTSGTAGTDLAFYWFPGITTVGATVTDGQSYGFFRTDSIDVPSGGNFSFNIPSDGGTASIYAFTLDQGGGYPQGTTFQATLNASAVPEPSRMILIVVGLSAFLMRRRRIA